MEQTKKQGTWTSLTRVAVPLLAGLVVLLLLFPAGGGVFTNPPQCFSMFKWYSVPCGGGLAVAAGVATAGVVGLALWLKDRRR